MRANTHTTFHTHKQLLWLQAKGEAVTVSIIHTRAWGVWFAISVGTGEQFSVQGSSALSKKNKMEATYCFATGCLSMCPVQQQGAACSPRMCNTVHSRHLLRALHAFHCATPPALQVNTDCIPEGSRPSNLSRIVNI
jgi:hypothetical protein